YSLSEPASILEQGSALQEANSVEELEVLPAEPLVDASLSVTAEPAEAASETMDGELIESEKTPSDHSALQAVAANDDEQFEAWPGGKGSEMQGVFAEGTAGRASGVGAGTGGVGRQGIGGLMAWSEAEMTGLGMPEVVLPEPVILPAESEPRLSLDDVMAAPVAAINPPAQDVPPSLLPPPANEEPVDDELLEVFIEEAAEVLETIDE